MSENELIKNGEKSKAYVIHKLMAVVLDLWIRIAYCIAFYSSFLRSASCRCA